MNRKETEKGYFIEKLYSLFPEWLFGKIRDVSGENDLAKVLPRASAGWPLGFGSNCAIMENEENHHHQLLPS